MGTDRLELAVERGWMDGGFTLTLDGNLHCFVPDEWAVALYGLTWRYPRMPTHRDLATYVKAHSEHLVLPTCRLGGWLADGYHHLEVTQPVEGYLPAWEFARKHQQLFMYHGWTGTTVAVCHTWSDQIEELLSHTQLDGLIPLSSPRSATAANAVIVDRGAPVTHRTLKSPTEDAMSSLALSQTGQD